METKNKIEKAEFHAVEFMRSVRSELSEKYLQDKEQYMKDLKKVMEDFKCRQKKVQDFDLQDKKCGNHK